jgi:hypothetical protein
MPVDPNRRFPPPWSVTDEETSWCVKDATGFPICWFVYDNRNRADVSAPDRMSREQAYAMAVNFARLPSLLRRAET